MTLTNAEKVRLMVGDTTAAGTVLSDDAISTLIADRTYVDGSGTSIVNIPAAAADAASALAAHYADSFNFAEDGQRFDVAQRVSHYTVLEQSLRSRSGGIAVPIGGTVSTT